MRQGKEWQKDIFLRNPRRYSVEFEKVMIFTEKVWVDFVKETQWR